MALILTASVSFGQVKNSRWDSKKMDISNSSSKIKNVKLEKTAPVQATICNLPYATASFENMSSAMKAQKSKSAETALTVSYGRPDGAMFEGFTRDYKSYTTATYLHSPAIIPVDYVPYSNDKTASFVWNYNSTDAKPITDSVETNGTLHFVADITPAGYISYLPKVTASIAGGTTATYVLGQNTSKQYLLASSVERTATADGTEHNGEMEFSPLTLGNNNANRTTSGNLYGSFSAGGSFSGAYSNENGPCKGVMQVLPKLVSPLYAESVSILAYENGGTAVPAGGVMKIKFYYLNEDGSLGELIKESKTDKFVKTYSTQGVFTFSFAEEEDGFIVKKPLVLGTKARVAVVVTGFDNTWNFKFLFGSNPFQGSSYTLHGDNLKVSTFGYTNAPTVPSSDLYIQFNGMFNCLTPIEKDASLTFPVAGGLGIAGHDDKGEAYNDLDLYSAYNMDDENTNVWIDNAPDWIESMDYDSTYFANYNAILLYFKAKALPAGVSGRSGEITIASHGISVKIPVTQGNVTSTNNPKTNTVIVAKSPNSFEVTKADNYTSVSLLNVSGQLIGKYPISQSAVSIPTSALTNGVYVLKFEGNGSEIIKVIK